jgi:PAS domain S-box-containing protein
MTPSPGENVRGALRRALSLVRPWAFAILVTGMTAGLVVLAAWRVRELRRSLLGAWEARMASLADGKKLALDTWLAERRAAASLVAEYAAGVEERRALRPRDTPGSSVEGEVARYWSAVQELAGYGSLWVFGADGSPVGRSAESVAPKAELLAAAREAAVDGRHRIMGPMRAAGGELVLAFVAPVLQPASQETGQLPTARGAVLLELDPSAHLFPLVGHQPIGAATLECYLVDRSGDSLVLLSPRLGPDAPPLGSAAWWTEAPMLERLAADGIRVSGVFPGESDGTVAATRRVAATGWGLVCGIRRAEALAGLGQQLRYEGLLLLALLVVLSLGLAAYRRAYHAVRRDAEAMAQARYRALVEGSLAGIYVIQNWRFAYVNPTLARIFGYTVAEVLAKPSVLDLVAEEDRGLVSERVRARLAGEEVASHYTFRGRRRDGAVIDVEVHGTRTDHDGPAITGTLIDITERRALEQQLRQAQKMEAVGQLAGGMAHDFNNLLTSILATTELLLGELPPDSPLRNDLAGVQSSARRGADLTRKLLAFSRRQRLEFHSVEVGALFQEFLGVLRRVVREDIDIRLEAAPGLTVTADPGALEQVLMNLVTNARDAMPEGGVIEIGVRPVALDQAACQAMGFGVPGSYVAVGVRDSGVGMDEATRVRVFEPFFTTKSVGEGTGLGLAMVYGLVKQHKGFTMVESALGRGTTVTVYLPQAVGRRASVPDQPSPVASGVGETILVVEDEASLLRIAKRVLEKHGYRVLTAADGQEALEVYRANRDRIDLVITDVVMPRLGGRELAEALRSEGGRGRVLLTSGYAERELGAAPPEPGVPLLTKPWSIPELLRLVREALEGPGRN